MGNENGDRRVPHARPMHPRRGGREPRMERGTRLIALAASAALLAFTAVGCGGDDNGGGGGGDGLSGNITIDGSSTVAPLSSAMAEKFAGENSDVNITVGSSGTGGAFRALLRRGDRHLGCVSPDRRRGSHGLRERRDRIPGVPGRVRRDHERDKHPGRRRRRQPDDGAARRRFGGRIPRSTTGPISRAVASRTRHYPWRGRTRSRAPTTSSTKRCSARMPRAR